MNKKSPAKNPVIETHHVTKFFRDEHGKPIVACEDVSLTVDEHEFVCIVGPSGCGKSTFLRIVAGLMKADEGTLELEPGARQAMVFQNAAIFPWLTVSDNIGYGLTMSGVPDRVREAAINQQLEQMSLKHAAHLHPKELSGGMKQRVGIARALAVSPDILLLDEPFSALDAFTAEKLRKDVLEIWRSQKRTVLMVTHLVEEAVQMADRIIVMTNRPGRIKTVIDVDLPRPRDMRSKAFYKLVDTVHDLVIAE